MNLGVLSLTMPNERRQAVNRTKQFLVDLMDPKKTPRVPRNVREQAYRCLKHYPGDWDMEQAAEQAPQVFGEWDAGLAISCAYCGSADCDVERCNTCGRSS